jgi:predicted RNA binding protein YcfA (HicA-like mRNA interferase family)
VPRKIRELIADLENVGFLRVPTKSSHRKYRHAGGTTVILSGQTGADAHHYQEKEVRRAIAAVQTSTNP